MAAASLDILVEQGATFTRLLTFQDSQGNQIDLTGNLYRAEIKQNVTDTIVVASFAFQILDQTDPTTKGQVIWSMDATTTMGIALRKQGNPARQVQAFCYDIEVTYPSAAVDRILQGLCNVSPEVTVS